MKLTKYKRGLFLLLLLLIPGFASASPWDGAAQGLLDILTGPLARIVALIVCVFIGFAAWGGRITWRMAGNFVLGIVFVFGASAIVDLIIGWTS